ncbi:MAG: methionyl-tRNA formyltransferase, partial [Treponema sp.]|nr:methionyl-tRNA formyltransferase [Treponema sp.]
VKLLILKSKVSENSTRDMKDVVIPGTVLPYRKSVGIEIACGDGSILVATELQWEKKKAMDYKSFMNGARNFVGSVLD